MKSLLKKGDEPDSKFDPKELKMGIEIETEHTDDKEVAKQIAKAHLSEFPDYYTNLKQMEDKMKKSKEGMEDEVKNWLKGLPQSPQDALVHKWADEKGYETDDVEAAIYKIAKKGLTKEIEKMESEIDMKKNPIQANPANPNTPNQQVDSKNVPKDKEAEEDKKIMIKEIERMEKQMEGVIPGKPNGTGPRAGTPGCPFNDEEEECAGSYKKQMQSISVRDYLGQKKEFLQMAGSVRSEKRVYIKDPSQAPPGANVQAGAHGGHYYDTDGGVSGGEKPKKSGPRSDGGRGIDIDKTYGKPQDDSIPTSEPGKHAMPGAHDSKGNPINWKSPLDVEQRPSGKDIPLDRDTGESKAQQSAVNNFLQTLKRDPSEAKNFVGKGGLTDEGMDELSRHMRDVGLDPNSDSFEDVLDEVMKSLNGNSAGGQEPDYYSRQYDDLEQGAEDVYNRLDKEIQSGNISDETASDIRQHVKDLTDIDDIRMIHDIIDRKIANKPAGG